MSHTAYSTTDKEIYEDKNGALAPFVVKTANGSLFTIYDVSHFFFFVLCFMIMSGRECSRPDGDFMNKDGCNKHPFS